LLEHSIHDVDVLRWILGDPSRVTARIASRFGYDGIDDVADVTFDLADGGVATLVSVWHQILQRSSSRRLEIFCEDALLWADDDNLGPLHVETADAEYDVAGVPPEWAARLDLSPELAHPLLQYATPAKAFLDALTAGVRPAPDGGVALAAHRIVDAAYRSAAKGGVPVEVAPRASSGPPPR
jgi:predicted dehydrogenase